MKNMSNRRISDLDDHEAKEAFTLLTNVNWYELHLQDQLKVRRFKRDEDGYLTIEFPILNVYNEPTGERGECKITDSLEVFVNLGIVDKRGYLTLNVASLVMCLQELNIQGATL